jgi:hypothetical protein
VEKKFKRQNKLLNDPSMTQRPNGFEEIIFLLLGRKEKCMFLIATVSDIDRYLSKYAFY